MITLFGTARFGLQEALTFALQQLFSEMFVRGSIMLRNFVAGHLVTVGDASPLRRP
jgi:hypothetical protein